MVVAPALNGHIAPFEYARGRGLTISSKYKRNEGFDHDWGIIKLDRNVGLYTGSFGCISAKSNSNSIYTGAIDTAGYPGDKGDGSEMYYTFGVGKKPNIFETLFHPTHHYFRLDAFPGQSGSPIWKDYDDGPYIVSILVLSDINYNIGTRIYPRLQEIIIDTLKTDAKKPPIDRADMDTLANTISDYKMSVCTRDPFEVSFRVKNRGTKDSSWFKVDFYLSTDIDISTSDYLLGSVDMNIIWPFCDEEVKWTGYIASNIPEGLYSLIWYIDSKNKVDEISETNNSYSSWIMV